MGNQLKADLLQAEVDEKDQRFFRLLASSQNIKYITVLPGIYSTEDMCFDPSQVSTLSKLSPRHWNDGLNPWNGTYVDYLGVSIRKKITNRCIVVARFARFCWKIQYIENETTFLSHLTENGRMIGFLMELITDGRHAGDQDVETCREVLSRLHDLGVQREDTNRFNFHPAIRKLH
ncbi:hypothetical protein BDW67DRAFT_178279 [Aspergillus spinulosporus]